MKKQKPKKVINDFCEECQNYGVLQNVECRWLCENCINIFISKKLVKRKRKTVVKDVTVTNVTK